MAAEPIAQAAKWRYVTTLADDTKTYFRDEIKILPDGNRQSWVRTIHSDESFSPILMEWNCSNQRRIYRQIILHNPDGLLAGKSKPPQRWEETVPGSVGGLLYVRICLPAQPVKWAQIIAPDTRLRQNSELDSPVIRTANRGERFEIVFETEKRRRVNIVDAETQEDYWLPRNEFEPVEGEQPLIKHFVVAATATISTVATAPTAKKRKRQKADA